MYQNQFIGRKDELNQLKQLLFKRTSSLVVIKGRRRVGKSRLVQEFSKEFKNFFELQGLPPTEGNSNTKQLQHYANKLSLAFNTRTENFESWTHAFQSLADKTQKGQWLIFIDEISWLGMHDPLFSGQLKEIWDTHFKHNQKLILIVCGSKSAWIEKNIVKNTGFEGRISLDILLQELSLPEANQFFKTNSKLGPLEKMWVLSVTGGVPMYLEEAITPQNQFHSLTQKCFTQNQFFYNEFSKIFSEIFMRKSKTLEKIIRICLDQKLSPVEISKKMKQPQSQDLTEALKTLELSGFISRDYFFKPNGEISKLSQIRIKDNYLRFYLKYIEPLKSKIEKGGKKIVNLTDLAGYDSMLGYQFENLVLANRTLLYPLLGLTDTNIISAAPYAQKKNTKNRGSCQVDLLIHTRLDVFYVVEFKCKKIIEKSLIKEVDIKINKITWPRRSSVRSVLVYLGELNPNHEHELKEYFTEMIPFANLLK